MRTSEFLKYIGFDEGMTLADAARSCLSDYEKIKKDADEDRAFVRSFMEGKAHEDDIQYFDENIVAEGFAAASEDILADMAWLSEGVAVERPGVIYSRPTTIDVIFTMCGFGPEKIEFTSAIRQGLPDAGELKALISTLPFSKAKVGSYVGVSARVVRHWCSGTNDSARAIRWPEWRRLQEMKEMADANRLLEQSVRQVLEPGATTEEESDAIRKFIAERGIKRYREGQLVTEKP